MSVFPLVLSAALSVPGAFTAANGLHVQPTGDASFAVPYAGLSAPTDFWCAADKTRGKTDMTCSCALRIT